MSAFKLFISRFLFGLLLLLFIASCSCSRDGKNAYQTEGLNVINTGNAEMDALLKEKEEQINQLGKDMDNLRAAIIAKDGAIVELNAQLESLHSDNQGLMTTLSDVMTSQKSTKIKLYVIISLLVASIILNIILILLLGKAKSNSLKDDKGDDFVNDDSIEFEENQLPKRGRGRPKGSVKKVEEEGSENITSEIEEENKN